jgi:hypothetical protein
MYAYNKFIHDQILSIIYALIQELPVLKGSNGPQQSTLRIAVFLMVKYRQFDTAMKVGEGRTLYPFWSRIYRDSVATRVNAFGVRE